MIKSIPLNKLVASPRNVRRAGDPQADAELKADIEARGLLQNLVVSSVSKPRGCFAVEAGERRRRALQSLVDDGKLAKDHEVCCLMVDSAEAQETSLAENFQRLAMNPADECLAFQQLVEQGSDSETIARRFGLTVRFVEGRLRLAGLAPVVFEALGAGEISLDVAKAYAATPDRDRQAYVFDQVSRSYMASHPDSIRRMMTQATASASDRRARFVGEEAYVAAGGRVERDLFSSDEQARWLDVELVERLAAEKLEALAAAIASEQGLAFVKPVTEGWIGYGDTEGLRRLELESPPLSNEESAKVDELEAEIEQLAALIDDEETSEADRDAADARVTELGDAIDAIVSKPPILGAEYEGRAGAFLLLAPDGQAVLGNRRFIEEPEAEDETGSALEPAGATGAPATTEQRPGMPRRLADELAMQRRDILSVHVAADADFAFDLAAFLMADTCSGYFGESAGSVLRAGLPTDPAPGFQAPQAAASVALAAGVEALDRSWTGGTTRAQRFDAFRALPEASRKLWFRLAVARTLEASLNLPGPHCRPFHDHLGRLLGVDVARWWRPAAANYFDRVPKSMAMAALADVGGPELCERYSKLKKPELAQACERVFAGDFIAEAEVKQAALAWSPEALRFAAPAVPEAESTTDAECDAAEHAAAAASGPEFEELGEAA